MNFDNQPAYQQGFENPMYQQGAQATNFPQGMQGGHQGFNPMYQQQRTNINHNLYKTSLCKNFQEAGTCSYAERCKFAHGENELRQPGQSWQRFGGQRGQFGGNKPQGVCRVFQSTGQCKFGDNCRYSHQF